MISFWIFIWSHKLKTYNDVFKIVFYIYDFFNRSEKLKCIVQLYKFIFSYLTC